MRFTMLRAAALSVFASAALIASMLLAPMAEAQNLAPQSTSGPYNTDLGTALVTLTAQAAGTVTSATQVNVIYSGLACTFNQSAHTGTPSTTMSLQIFDAATNAFFTVATTGAITADATPTYIFAKAGNVATSVPTGAVILGLNVTRKWRISVTVAGTTPVVTAKVGCNYIK